MLKLQDKILIFYFITAYGSALSSVSSFLSIENFFSNIKYLAFALAMKTLAAAFFSFFTEKIVKFVDLRSSLIISQLIGCLSLIVLFLGFYCHNYILTVCGIMLSGLAPNYVAILVSIILKISSNSNDEYRSSSGRRELIVGFAVFIAFLMAPILLEKINLNSILLIDGITYVIGTLILVYMKLPTGNSKMQNNINSFSFTKNQLSISSFWNFITQTSSSLLLAGLTPLLASSSHINLSDSLPILMRQSMWSIEAATAIIASSIYLMFNKTLKTYLYEASLMLNAFLLFIPLVIKWNYAIVISAMLISIELALSYMQFRDDLLISAGNNTTLIKSYSAYSLMQKNIIYFLSPLILGYIFSHLDVIKSIICLVCIQLLLTFTNFMSKQMKLSYAS